MLGAYRGALGGARVRFAAPVFFFLANCSTTPEVRPTTAGRAAPAPAPTPAAAAPAKPPPQARADLLPRRIALGDPDRSTPRLSPDGRRLAFVAPHEGVKNLWVGPADDPKAARPVTTDRKRGVGDYLWAHTGRHLLYRQDHDGDEKFHVFAVDVVAGGPPRDLTPIEGVGARFAATSPRAPDEVLLGLNDRDPRYHDLYRVNVRTGARKLVAKNEGFTGLVADASFAPRFALRPTPSGGTEVLSVKGPGRYDPFLDVTFDDDLTTRLVGLDRAGRTLYLLDSGGRNTSALFAVDVATKKRTLLAEDPKADLVEPLLHPTEGRAQAVSGMYERLHWKVLDPAVGPDFDLLGRVAEGDLRVIDRSTDDRVWLVSYTVGDGPVRFYRYDRGQKKAHFLFTENSAIGAYQLSTVRPVTIGARDGLELVGYLALPPGSDADGDGRPDRPLPMVLLVHGGPWDRDTFGFNPGHQWLASRGYAALSVNFRGSSGFGKAFLNAGNLEWGRKMHYDVLDAVAWAVDRGVADRSRVALLGGSYGGYEVLVGLTSDPDAFACGVDIVGPSNVATLLEAVPPHFSPLAEMLARRVGDLRTPEGRALLAERSPLHRADRTKKPLLVAQGANDPRVKRAESDRFVDAVRGQGVPVTYLVYPDEGHGFERPENNYSLNAVLDIFLAQCLGGVYEPIGRDLEGSSMTVQAGVEHIYGLRDALRPGK
jgi:dipeptidyl aminopeptidase/acylaminoacyl peptidase